MKLTDACHVVSLPRGSWVWEGGNGGKEPLVAEALLLPELVHLTQPVPVPGDLRAQRTTASSVWNACVGLTVFILKCKILGYGYQH